MFNRDRKKAHNYIAAALLGDTLLSLGLIPPTYLERRRNLGLYDESYLETTELQQYLSILFDDSYRAYNDATPPYKQLGMNSNIKLMACQMAYFMTDTYVRNYLQKAPIRQSLFPGAEIGQVVEGRGWVYNRGWDRTDRLHKIPTIGKEDVVRNSADLGPVNGPNPLQELIRALYLTTTIMTASPRITSAQGNAPARHKPKSWRLRFGRRNYKPDQDENTPLDQNPPLVPKPISYAEANTQGADGVAKNGKVSRHDQTKSLKEEMLTAISGLRTVDEIREYIQNKIRPEFDSIDRLTPDEAMQVLQAVLNPDLVTVIVEKYRDDPYPCDKITNTYSGITWIVQRVIRLKCLESRLSEVASLTEKFMSDALQKSEPLNILTAYEAIGYLLSPALDHTEAETRVAQQILSNSVIQDLTYAGFLKIFEPKIMHPYAQTFTSLLDFMLDKNQNGKWDDKIRQWAPEIADRMKKYSEVRYYLNSRWHRSTIVRLFRVSPSTFNDPELLNLLVNGSLDKINGLDGGRGDTGGDHWHNLQALSEALEAKGVSPAIDIYSPFKGLTSKLEAFADWAEPAYAVARPQEGVAYRELMNRFIERVRNSSKVATVDKSRSSTAGTASFKSEMDEAEKIHQKNLKYTPAIPGKTILCHIIVDSILPPEQWNMLSMLEQDMEDKSYAEKVARLSIDDGSTFIDDLRREMARQKNKYEKLYGSDCAVEFDIACPNIRLVEKALNSGLGVKALAFERCEEPAQVEGIIMALRALHTGNLEKLMAIVGILAVDHPEKLAGIKTIEDFVKQITFILPTARKINYNDVRKLNDIIRENIKTAA